MYPKKKKVSTFFSKKFFFIVTVICISFGIVGIIFFNVDNLDSKTTFDETFEFPAIIDNIIYPTNYPTEIYMNNTISSIGLSTNSERSIHTQYISSTSSLVGKSIDNITIKLKRDGQPSGIVQVGIFNEDRSIKHLFGTKETSEILPNYNDYPFSLPLGQSYQIQSGDRIGIKFTDGDSSNYIAIMTDQTNSFDGQNSYHTYYTDSWKKFTSNDLYMILKTSKNNSDLTVDASPRDSIFNTPQLVTLISNKPATIFYTDDGSIPTDSSKVYSLPILISSDTTLKFFAMDEKGDTSLTAIRVYTILPSSDGITQLFPTVPGGGEWFSKWDNGKQRTINDGDRDPFDSMFILTGSSDSELEIDGNGIASMSGTQPRMYVNDKDGLINWKNTEVTFYSKYTWKFYSDSSAGMNIGARSNHLFNNGCNVDTYYSRMLYDGGANFKKELAHPNDSASLPLLNKIDWGGIGRMPTDTWIGHKFVIRDSDKGKNVNLQMYLDTTDGVNGGDWKLVAELNDEGNWPVPSNSCGITRNKIILESNPSIFIRNTDVSSVLYKQFSVREIYPLP